MGVTTFGIVTSQTTLGIITSRATLGASRRVRIALGGGRTLARRRSLGHLGSLARGSLAFLSFLAFTGF